jgi:hypothetical protein
MPIDRKQLVLRKLPAASANVVMPLVLSITMSGIVSAVVTATSAAPGPGFATTLLKAWGLSCAVAFPSLLVLLPVVRRVVALVVEQPR